MPPKRGAPPVWAASPRPNAAAAAPASRPSQTRPPTRAWTGPAGLGSEHTHAHARAQVRRALVRRGPAGISPESSMRNVLASALRGLGTSPSARSTCTATLIASHRLWRLRCTCRDQALHRHVVAALVARQLQPRRREVGQRRWTRRQRRSLGGALGRRLRRMHARAGWSAQWELPTRASVGFGGARSSWRPAAPQAAPRAGGSTPGAGGARRRGRWAAGQ